MHQLFLCEVMQQLQLLTTQKLLSKVKFLFIPQILKVNQRTNKSDNEGVRRYVVLLVDHLLIRPKIMSTENIYLFSNSLVNVTELTMFSCSPLSTLQLVFLFHFKKVIQS